MAEKRAQRRLAAILAADVVGYSGMMREDETGTLAQLKTLLKEVFDPRTAEHSGRIVKTTGDGVLVEFASAVDATECAIKVQRALARRNEDGTAARMTAREMFESFERDAADFETLKICVG